MPIFVRFWKADNTNVTQSISHKGIVQAVEGPQVRVCILQASACSGCAAKSMCTSAESKEKVVQVVVDQPELFAAGQVVVVVGRLRDGLSAALLAYALPLIILIVVLLGVILLTGKEVMAAGCALAALVPYYLVIHALRHRIARRFSFHLQTIENQ